MSSFSLGRAYSFLNFLPPLFLRSIPTLIIQGSTSLLTTPPQCQFLMCTPLPYSLYSDRWQNRLLISLHSSLLQKSLHSGGFNCHHPLWDPRGNSDLCKEEVFDWDISFDLLPLNDPDTPTLLHRSTGSRSSPDISFAPSFLAPERCFRTWVLTTYLFFYLFLYPRFFAPTSVPLPSTF